MNILRKAQGDVDLILDQYLDSVLKKIKDYKEHLSLRGKNIEVANVEQSSYLAYYDEIRVELKSLVNYYEVKTKEAKAQAWKNLNKLSKIDHSDREKDIIVTDDPTFKKANQTLLFVKEMYDTLDSICEQFQSRAFSLNNIVKIRVASLEGISLYE